MSAPCQGIKYASSKHSTLCGTGNDVATLHCETSGMKLPAHREVCPVRTNCQVYDDGKHVFLVMF